MVQAGTIYGSTGNHIRARMTKKVVLDALQGQWQLSRTLLSAIPTYPSGKLTGRATFEKRTSTAAGFGEECLYSEVGDFITDKNFTMKAKRQYVYRYEQTIDSLSVWFVKGDGGATVDYLFHRLEFTNEEGKFREGISTNAETVLIAKGHHLCVDDDYTAEYIFRFMGQELADWTVKFTVKGPRKDYVANAKYSRPLTGTNGDIPIVSEVTA